MILPTLHMFVLAMLENVSQRKCATEEVCTGAPIQLPASSTSQTLMSAVYTKDLTSSIYKCSWIISSYNMSDVITYSLRRLFTGSTSTCGYDYVIIRDGSTANGPPLHVWCRGTAEEEEEVKSYSNSIYVELVATSYDRSGIVFIMSYSATEKNLVIESPVELEPLNYFLIAVSCLVIIALIAGIVILVYREIKLAREAKAVKFKQKLRVRRKGISGISGGVMNKHFLPDDIEEERKSLDENSYSAVSVTPDSRGLDNTVSTSLSSETPTLDRRPDSASLRRVSFANNRDHSQGSMSLASLYIGQRIEHLINDDSSLTRISVTSSSDTGV